MSWSVSLIGSAANISAALTAESSKLGGQSKVEFDDALPHLIALVNQNFADPSQTQYVAPALKLEASGSGYVSADGTKQLQRSFKMHIETFYSRLV